MKIGIDISQTIYSGGVSEYLTGLVEELIKVDDKNEYILFGSSLRGGDKFIKWQNHFKDHTSVKFKIFSFPPTLLDLLWNTLHIFPIELLIGKVDIFITSDWTEPPAKSAIKATILYDLIVYKYPEETHNQTKFDPFKFIISANIVASQKRKLKWVKKESDLIFCISKSTKEDAIQILGLPEEKLKVVYPGFTL